MSGFPENPGLTNRGSGNSRICNICSILVVSLATNECVLVNASAPEMPPGGSESYGIYGTSAPGRSKTLVFLRVPELKYRKYHMIRTLPEAFLVPKH